MYSIQVVTAVVLGLICFSLGYPGSKIAKKMPFAAGFLHAIGVMTLIQIIVILWWRKL